MITQAQNKKVPSERMSLHFDISEYVCRKMFENFKSLWVQNLILHSIESTINNLQPFENSWYGKCNLVPHVIYHPPLL